MGEIVPIHLSPRRLHWRWNRNWHLDCRVATINNFVLNTVIAYNFSMGQDVSILNGIPALSHIDDLGTGTLVGIVGWCYGASYVARDST